MNLSSPVRRRALVALTCLAAARLAAVDLTCDNTPDNPAGDITNFLTGTSSGPFSGNLRYCIWVANGNPGSRIFISNSATRVLNQMLPPITAPVTIEPSIAVHLDGLNLSRILFIDVPGNGVVTLRGITFSNARAQGGAGVHKSGGGGGLGGAIYVNAGRLVLENCQFENPSIVGGNGGNRVVGNAAGGGGGLGGNGGSNSGGGGGLLGNGGGGANGSGGIDSTTGGGGGGLRGNGGNGSPNNYAGGGGGTVSSSGQGGAGGGGSGASAGSQQGGNPGGVNGGGGGGVSGSPEFGYITGGAGGKYGGGGGGAAGTTRGGAGGFGAGGGAAVATAGAGGAGGFAGGNGASGASGGSGGSAYGGCIFVRASGPEPASVQIFDGGLVAATATGGAGGTGEPSSGGVNGTPGQTGGTSIFYHLGNGASQDFVLSANNGFDYSVDGSIGTEPSATAGLNLIKVGVNKTTLGAPNTFNGSVQINVGTLKLAPGANLGASTNILFNSAALDLGGNSLTVNGINSASGGLVTSSAAGAMLLTLQNVSYDASYAGAIANGSGTVSLLKIGSFRQTLNGLSTYSGGTTVTGGTLRLSGNDGSGNGTIVGDLSVTGATVETTVANAFGYATGRKVNAVTLDAGTLIHSGNSDNGWGIAYQLKNGSSMYSNGGSGDPNAASKFTFGGETTPTTLNVSGTGISVLGGRVDLRPDFGRTSVEFTVAANSQLNVPASITSAAGPVGLNKLGAGSMYLQSINTFTGGTVVTAGLLNLGPALASQPGIGLLRGGITVTSPARLETQSDSFGYLAGNRVDALVLNNTRLDHYAPGNLGWAVTYTLNGGTMQAHPGAAFAFGGNTPSQGTVVNTVDATANSILGSIDLRADGGITNTTLNVVGTSTLALSGTISSSQGAAGLTKAGTGTLTLSGNNTYAGTTVLAAGVTVVSTNSALGSGPISFTGGTLRYATGVTNGDFSSRFNSATGTFNIDTNSLDIAYAGPLSGNSGLNKIGLGTLTLSGNSNYTGQTTLGGGVLAVGHDNALGASGSIAFAGGTLRYVGINRDFSNRFVTPSTARFNIDTNGQNVIFATALAGSAGLTKLGAGTLTLAANNPNLTGGFTIGGGTLQVGNGTAGSLGNGNDAIVNNGTLAFNHVGTFQQNGLISGTGGLRLDGPGTLVLTANETYTGATVVNGGVLQAPNRLYTIGGLGGTAGSITVNGGTFVFPFSDTLGHDGATPVTTVAINPGGRIENGASYNVFNALTLNGAELWANGGYSAEYPAYRFRGTVTVTGSAASSIKVSNSSNDSNQINLSAATTFNVADVTGSTAADLTIDPVLQNALDGTGSLTKTGPGTLRLNGANTYTGATNLSGGTLALGPSGTLGATASAVVLASGTTLDVTALTSGFSIIGGRSLTNNGIIRGVVVLNGGIYAGNGEILGGLNLEPGAVLHRTAGSNLRVTGTIVNKGILRFTGGALFDASGVTTIDNQGVIDLISAAPASELPHNIINTANSIVLTPSNQKVKSASKAGSIVTIQVDGFTAHTYQLQRSSGMAPSATFTNVGAPQAGTGTTAPVVLTFTDDAASAAESFYRVVVQ